MQLTFLQNDMELYQIEDVRIYYPDYAARADATAARIGSYWGRERVSKAFVCDNCERLFA